MESRISTDQRLTHSYPFLFPWLDIMAQSDTCWKAAGWYKRAQGFDSSIQNASLPPTIHEFDVHPHRSHKTASLENICPVKYTPFLSFFFPPSPLLIAATPKHRRLHWHKRKKSRGNSDPVLDTLNVLFFFYFFLPLLKFNKKIQKYVTAEWFRSEFSKTAPDLGNVPRALGC